MTESGSAMFDSLFDAMPSIAVVVDDDGRIRAFNRAAAAVLRDGGDGAIDMRAGEAFECVHATDVAEGCGRGPACSMCVLRNSINAAFDGAGVVRKRARIELMSSGERVELYALVTAARFDFDGRQLAFLFIEDISIIAELQRIIPICASCGKIRDSEDAWVRVEKYFSDTWAVDFSHGMCPTCLNKQLALLRAE